MGGAQVVTYLVGILRTKLVAVLLGPAGVGLVGVYLAITALIGTVGGLGLNSSGVREVAEASASGDARRLAGVVITLRRASWFTGALSWLLLTLLAVPLSDWTFGSQSQAPQLAILGAMLLLTALDAGEASIVQGSRRIGDLARRTMVQAALGTVVAVGGYYWLGEAGIIPVLVVTAGANYGVSWWFSHRLGLERLNMRWRDSWAQSQRLIALGLAFMWSGLLGAGTSLAIRALIVRDLGMDASGMYQAAWALSGMFAAFILAAMGSDFYPRLTAVAQDDDEVNVLVNQQTEIGILLALPGVLGTMAFAPWVMRAFYSSEFTPGTALLPWFVLGVLGRVVSWPMAFILLAKGASRWFAAMETAVSVVHLFLAFGLMRWVGLWGTAAAFAALYLLYTIALMVVARHLTNFRWSGPATRLLFTSTTLTVASFAVQRWAADPVGMVGGALLTSAAALSSVRGIASRLGETNRLVGLVCRLPGGRRICGLPE